MLKRILLSCALFITTIQVAMADPVPYIGIGTGIIINTSNQSLLSTFRGVPLNFYLGYGGLLDPSFYLASELMVTAGTGTLTSGQLKTTYGYGISLIPGLMLTNQTLSFLRFSLLRARASTLSTSPNGGQVGLGMQTGLTQNVDVRMEYDYTFFRGFSRGGTSIGLRSDQFLLGLLYKFG
jgi:opacity protein-like surface antigen